MPSVRQVIEFLLPWYDPVREMRRDVVSARVQRRSENARLRAARVIEEYQQAEDVAIRVGDKAGMAVAEFQEAQEDAKEAGERLVVVTEELAGKGE